MVAASGFIDTFRAGTADPGYTGDQAIHSPTSTVTERIDYVYARRGGCPITVTAADTFPDAPTIVAGGPLWPSDHHGVVSDVAIGC
jgi:hypothetical protein